MRRLITLISSLLFLELVFFAVVSPLVPALKHELALSTSEAGLLVAAYAAGGIVGAIPFVVLAARAGAKLVAIGGLAILSLSSLAFAAAKGLDPLLIARFAQGLGGAACWTAAMVWLLELAPIEHRGATLGFAFGVSEAGAIAGPALGGLAASVGRGPTFVGVAALCLPLALAISRAPAPPLLEGPLPFLSLGRVGPLRTMMAVALLPTIILAGILVLAPLQQHSLGIGAGGIAATLAAAAAIGILIRPLVGRWSDTHGSMRTVRLAILGCVPVVFAVPWPHSRWAASLLVVVALVLVGVLWAPLMVMLADVCTTAGFAQVMAVAVMNLTWPPGNIIGAAGGAAIAQAAGQRWAWAAMAGALLAGLVTLARMHTPAPASTSTSTSTSTSKGVYAPGM